VDCYQQAFGGLLRKPGCLARARARARRRPCSRTLSPPACFHLADPAVCVRALVLCRPAGMLLLCQRVCPSICRGSGGAPRHVLCSPGRLMTDPRRQAVM